MNHANNDLDEFFGEMEEEFETLESVIEDALEIINIHENKIELSKLR